MELADHVADHAGAFLEGGAGVEPQLPHGVEQPPMDRLQAVARIRQRAVHDGGERIGEIALFERVAQGDLLDVGGSGISRSPMATRYRKRPPANNPPLLSPSAARREGNGGSVAARPPRYCESKYDDR